MQCQASCDTSLDFQNSAQLELMFGLVEFEFRLGWSVEDDDDFFWGGTLIFFLHILSSLVNVRLHTENWLGNLPGSALKVPVVVVGG